MNPFLLALSLNEVQVDYALPNGFKWQVYCTDNSWMMPLAANSLWQIHDGFAKWEKL